MASNVVLLTTCTNRKRSIVPEALHASTLKNGSQEELLFQWVDRLSNNVDLHSVSQVYCGRSFSEASLARQDVSGELWIISAGLGLVSLSDKIPSYSLTITSNGSDNIAKKIIGQSFEPSKWWQGINDSNPNPISDLVIKNPDKLFIFAISSSYIQLIASDLSAIPDADIGRVRFIGLSIRDTMENRFDRYVMPYDERFDGPDSKYRGTRSDFSQRAMRHFIKEIVRYAPHQDANNHFVLVDQKLKDHRLPQKFNRIRKSDDEILDIINKHSSSLGNSSSQMLRFIRDHENIACEQKRFYKLFQSTRSEPNK